MRTPTRIAAPFCSFKCHCTPCLNTTLHNSDVGRTEQHATAFQDSTIYIRIALGGTTDYHAQHCATEHEVIHEHSSHPDAPLIVATCCPVQAGVLVTAPGLAADAPAFTVTVTLQLVQPGNGAPAPVKLASSSSTTTVTLSGTTNQAEVRTATPRTSLP